MVAKDKLPNTIPLKIVQIINYLNVIGILFTTILWLSVFEFFGVGWAGYFFTIIATIILLLIMRYFIRGLNRYDNQTKNIYLIIPVIEVFIIIFLIIDGLNFNFIVALLAAVALVLPIFQIYALLYHKPTSDYFKS